MPTCHSCGDEFEFRYVGGSVSPIHVNGGWCSGERKSATPSLNHSFHFVNSYLDPNALCPICGDHVYFFRCRNGGRVFFDDVGWPWPKHACTDNPDAQTGPVTPSMARVRKTFLLGSRGNALDVYSLEEFQVDEENIHLKFRHKALSQAFRAVITRRELTNNSIEIADLESAPSFVIDTYEGYREISFISERLKRIASFAAERMKRA